MIIVEVFMPKKILQRQTNWLDQATFPKILAIWLTITLLFGCGYYFLANDFDYLIYSADHSQVHSLSDTIYFSFIAATTTGFGDIVPHGWFKLIAIFQVVIGLLLLAIVTSRLVSIKQDAILTELYDISFKERLHRLRSSLLLFRQSIDRITTSIEEKEFKEKDLKNINGYLTSFDYTLTEIRSELESNLKNKYITNIDQIDSEILFNSTLNSFEKTSELLKLLEKNKINWKEDVSMGLMTKCLDSNDQLFRIAHLLGLKKETTQGLEKRKQIIKQQLKEIIFD